MLQAYSSAILWTIVNKTPSPTTKSSAIICCSETQQIIWKIVQSLVVVFILSMSLELWGFLLSSLEIVYFYGKDKHTQKVSLVSIL